MKIPGSLFVADGAQKAACNHYALHLPFAEANGSLTDGSVKSIGKVEDKVGNRGVNCLKHLLLGSFGSSKKQIVANAAAHQRIALGNIGDAMAHSSLGDGAALIII